MKNQISRCFLCRTFVAIHRALAPAGARRGSIKGSSLPIPSNKIK
jgi:hypothetical protein